jgi:hypothetical protein
MLVFTACEGRLGALVAANLFAALKNLSGAPTGCRSSF